MLSPVERMPLQLANGTGTCGGLFGTDFNAWIASGSDPALVAGTTVRAQLWSRDPGDALESSLTNALEFVIQP